jgi:predicted metal-dependent phosphoesterase TrpH
MTIARAACHVHSDWSYDGSWPLPDIARAFARRRYDVVLMAEHDAGFTPERWDSYREACAAVSTDGLLVVPGIEYSDPENCVHIAVWGALPFLGEGLQTASLLRWVEQRRGVAVLAHPDRRDAWRRLEPSWLGGLTGIEVWNRKYDGWGPSRLAGAVVASQPGLVPFVGNDFHTARQFFPLAMLLEVDGTPGVDGVYDALRARRCQGRALRLPAERTGEGVPGAVLREAERVRRPVARALRSMRAG